MRALCSRCALHDVLERLPLPRRFGERKHEQRDEEQREAEPGSAASNRAAASRNAAYPERTSATTQPSASSAELRGFHRGVAKTSSVPSSRKASASAAAPTLADAAASGRTGSREVAHESRLRASRTPERRVLVLDDAEAGYADEHQLLLDLLRIEPAVQHIDRGDEAIGVVRRIVDADGAVLLGGRDEFAHADALYRRAAT